MAKSNTRNILLTFLIVVLAVPIAAQDGTMISKLEDELYRTDEIISRAKELVQGANSEKAKIALEQATELQVRAWNRFRNRQNQHDLKISLGLTVKARERARVALEIAKKTVQNEHIVLRELEQAEDLLERARECASQTTDASWEGLYRSARENIDKAWQLYRSGHHYASLKLATQIKNSARKFLQACSGLSNRVSRYDNWSESVQELLNRAQEQVDNCDFETAAQMLTQAKQAFERAERLASENRFRMAEGALLSARTLAGKALRQCRGTDWLERRYNELNDRVNQLAENVAPSDDTAVRLLDQAREQLQLARESLDGGRSKAATAALKATQMNIERLQRLLNGNGLE